jgi:hypothetical protein
MNDREDDDDLFSHAIDQAIRPNQELAKLLVLELRNDLSTLGELTEGCRSMDDLPRQRGCIVLRVSSDEVGYCLKIITC